MFLERSGRVSKCLETPSVLALLTHPFLPTWCHTDYTFGVLWGGFFVHSCVCVCVRVCVCVGVYSGGHHIIFFFCKLISFWELCCRCHLGNRNSLFAFNTEIIFAVMGPLISGISQPHERGVSVLNPKTLLKQHDLAPTPHCLSWGPRSSRFTGWLSRMVVWTEKAEKVSVVLEESQRIFPLASLYWSESLIISFYVFSSYS